MRPPSRFATVLAVACLTLASAPRGWSAEGGWVDLSGLDAWSSPTDGWETVALAGLDPKDPKKLAVEQGSGAIYNGPTGRGKNLISKEQFEDTLRRFLRREPFIPFVIEMLDGTQVEVDYPSVAFNQGGGCYFTSTFDLIEFHCNMVREIRLVSFETAP